MPGPEGIRNITDNQKRKCYVNESKIPVDMKSMIYHHLLNIDHSSNNFICAAKELYYSFINEPVIKMRMERYAAGYHANMIARYSEILEQQETSFNKLKNDGIEVLREFFKKQTVELDRLVNNAYPHGLEPNQTNYLFAKEVLQRKVFKFNELAEKKRSEALDETKHFMNIEITRNFSDNKYTQPPTACCVVTTATGGGGTAGEIHEEGAIAEFTSRAKDNTFSTRDTEDRDSTSVMNRIPTPIVVQPVVIRSNLEEVIARELQPEPKKLIAGLTDAEWAAISKITIGELQNKATTGVSLSNQYISSISESGKQGFDLNLGL